MCSKASSVSLSSKLLFNGAKLLTVRTLSLDGNAESKDSEPIRLSKSMMAPPQPLPQPQPPPPVPPAPTPTSLEAKKRVNPLESIQQQQQSILSSVLNTTANLLGGNLNTPASNVTKPSVNEPKINQTVVSEAKIAQPQFAPNNPIQSIPAVPVNNLIEEKVDLFL